MIRGILKETREMTDIIAEASTPFQASLPVIADTEVTVPAPSTPGADIPPDERQPWGGATIESDKGVAVKTEASLEK